MKNDNRIINILERDFREKRIYGDTEDFKFFNPEKDPASKNCRILVNEYYSHNGFPYQNNKAAEEDQSNYAMLSIKSVQEALKQFLLIKLKGFGMLDLPLFRIDLSKPPLLNNVIPMKYSHYYQQTYTRKMDIFKANPYYSRGLELEELAIERNELVIKMQNDPNSRNPNSSEMRKYNDVFSKMREIENDLIIEHIEKNLGKIKHSLFVENDNLSFWLHQIPKLKEKDYGAIITSGFSMMPLNVPADLNLIFSYLELIITIPSDFPIPLKYEKNYEFYWLIEKLKFFMDYIHMEKTFFVHGHTYGNGDPPKPFIKSSEMCGFLFQYPYEELPANFCELIIPPIMNIQFLQLVPLYENELYFVLQNSVETLEKEFITKEIPFLFDLDRRNSLSTDEYISDYGKTAIFCRKCGTVLRNIESKQKRVQCPNCKNKIKLKK